MEYCSLGRSGIRVSRFGLGSMMFGGPADPAESMRIIDAALDMGVNFIDTANVYNAGESERIVGRAIVDRRDQVVLATKASVPVGSGPNDSGAGRSHLMRELEKSLRRLETDFVDIFYVHAPDPLTPVEETLRALDDMVKSGKVRYIGCSNYRAWRLCESLWTSDRLNLHRFSCVQPLYNALNRDIEVDLLPLCREHGVGVVTYSPLARGVLTGKYQVGSKPPGGSRAARGDARIQQTELNDAKIAASGQIADYCRSRDVAPSQFAIAWCLASPVVTSVIMGPRTLEQFQDNCGALDVSISSDDEKFIDSLVPPGEHAGRGCQDPAFPIDGRG